MWLPEILKLSENYVKQAFDPAGRGREKKTAEPNNVEHIIESFHEAHAPNLQI